MVCGINAGTFFYKVKTSLGCVMSLKGLKIKLKRKQTIILSWCLFLLAKLTKMNIDSKIVQSYVAQLAVAVE